MNARLRALLYSHERFLAGDVNAVCLDLRGMNLSRQDFSNRDLRRANLSRVNLEGANLRETNLVGANLSGANLHCAKIIGANFTDAILSRCFAAFVDFKECNLTNADLTGADLRGAFWSGAIWGDEDSVTLAKAKITPEGDIIGWKKLRGERVAKLLIPKDAKRSNGFGRRCRSQHVVVLAMWDKHGVPVNSGTSKRDARLKYEVGKITKADGWDEDWANECSHGINFFITKEEAESYG